MNRIKDYEKLKNDICKWMIDYATLPKKYQRCDENGFWSVSKKFPYWVIGVSGGIDSAVASTLACESGLEVIAVNMPLLSQERDTFLADVHLKFLEKKYPCIANIQTISLSKIYVNYMTAMRKAREELFRNSLANANTKSRLRMMTLYHIAGSWRGCVVGTGNKVEDYGVGFYTKYGDGGVDIAPIAALYKTEVRELAKHLGIDKRIIEAPPTDGLWEDGRTDEAQIGATYEELEEAMEYGSGPAVETLEYFKEQNEHKMLPIPTFKLQKEHIY